MTYWGGASINSKCACGMTNSCADYRYGCNCDKNDRVWREDSGLLTDKTKLLVKQLRFGDTGYGQEVRLPHTGETEVLRNSINTNLRTALLSWRIALRTILCDK